MILRPVIFFISLGISFGFYPYLSLAQVNSAAPKPSPTKSTAAKPATTQASSSKPKASRYKPGVTASKKSTVESDSSEDSSKAVKGPPVLEIEIMGNKKIEKDAILFRLKSKVNEAFDPEVVHRDILEIFKMGFFYDVQVLRDEKGSGVKLTYKLQEKPSIAEIKFSGQSELSEDDLKDSTGIKIYEILNINSLRTATEKMEKVYEEKGYFLAKVNYRVEDVAPGETVRVIFDIKENDKVKVKKITFLGNRQLPDGELLGPMQTKEEGLFSFMSSSGAFKQEVFDRDMQMLNFLYFNKGYVQVKIGKPEIYVTPDKRSIYITIRVDEGERFNIGDVDFSGDLLFPREELFQTIKVKSPATFSYEALQADLNTLQAKYGDLGYAFANIIPRTSIREKEKLVDITFEVDRGNKVYFGEINMIGNTKTRDKVIRRELKILEGELYNETRKRESMANVRRLGFFDDVAFNQKTPAENSDIVNVDIAVKERNTGSIQVGAGFSSYSGAVFNGQIQQSNLFGLGQKLGISIDLSKINSLFNLNYTDPYFKDTDWSLGFDLYRSSRILLYYNEIKSGGAIRVGHPLAPYFMGFLRYKNETTELNFDGKTAVDTNVYPIWTANGRTSSVTLTLEYDKRNDRMAPSDGFYASTSYEYAGLGGELNYNKFFATGRYYKKIFWDLVFRNNLTYGLIDTLNGTAPPFNELFLLGGANTLRGFTWFTVGPSIYSSTYGRNVPVGGRQELFYNGEFEFPLITEAGIKGVVFYDMGYAADGLSFDKLRSDVGFGFRWFSPIGPLRFEWGFPINPQPGETPMNFEFAIGAPF